MKVFLINKRNIVKYFFLASDGVNIFEGFVEGCIKPLRILKELDISKIKNLVCVDEHSYFLDYMKIMLDINNLDNEKIKEKLHCIEIFLSFSYFCYIFYILVVNTSIKKALFCSQSNIFKDINLKSMKYHMINLDSFYNSIPYIEPAINALHNGGVFMKNFIFIFVFLRAIINHFF